MSIDFAAMDRALNPKTVAVLGERTSRAHMFLPALRRFKGALYAVQPDPEEARRITEMGFECVPTLDAIDEPVDYVIVALSRKYADDGLRECARAGVGGVCMYTAGYAETGEPGGAEAQAEIERIARAASLVMLGPNCMGLHNPSRGVRYLPFQPLYDGGYVGFASQSGSHGNFFSLAAPYNGLPLSKMISFGNGVVLESTDYLEYFGQDPQTRAIVLYVESVKDGRRFLDVLREVAARKPVILWKGGRTEDGRRAAASHTAALAESMAMWRAAAQQTGAVLVTSIEEALDTLQVIVKLPELHGAGCGLIGGQGGQSVAIADAFAEHGLRVPPLSDASKAELGAYFKLVGASASNPIDLGMNMTDIDRTLDILEADPVIDVIGMQIGILATEERHQGMRAAHVRSSKRTAARGCKPAVAIPYSLLPYEHAEVLRETEQELRDAGIPCFPSYHRAAKAIRNAVDYHQARRAIAAAG